LVSSNLKKRFEEKTKTLVLPLSRIGVKPNHLTLFGLIAAAITILLYILHTSNPITLVLAGIMILLSGFIDAIDGVLARNTGQVTRFGGFLDSVIDRYSDLFIISGAIIGGIVEPLTGLIALIGSVMVSYTRARAEAEGVKMSGVGFAERAERLIFLAVCSIISFFWIKIMSWGILILAVVTNLTVLQRILYFKKEVEKN
jgi:archaetidylinositol phosphate synthase